MKQKKGIKRLLISLFIFLIGITNVNAEETPVPVGYISSNTNLIISNNKGSDISLNLGVLNTNPIDIKNIIIGINNYSFRANVIYRIEISTPTQYLINVNSFEILAGDNACSYRNFKFADTGYPSIEFSCPYDTDYLTISLSNSAGNNITNSYNFRWDYTYLYTITNVINFNPVIDNNNQNTQDIIDNNTSNTDSIIDNNNQNTQDIIDSNKETQEVIKDQFNDCYTNLFKGQFAQTNIVGETSDLRLFAADNYYIEAGKTYTFSTNVNLDGIMYGINLSTVPHPTSTSNRVFDSGWQKGSIYTFTPSVSGYFGLLLAKNNTNQKLLLSEIEGKWFMLVEGSTSKPYSPYGEQICSNKIDETNDKLDGIQGALTDDSSPNITGLENSAGWLPPGPLDSLINLPLSFFNSISRNLNNNCQPIILPLPYVNKTLTLPCMNTIYNKIGIESFMDWIGVIASGFILYSYLMNLYKWVDETLDLRAKNALGDWGGI